MKKEDTKKEEEKKETGEKTEAEKITKEKKTSDELTPLSDIKEPETASASEEKDEEKAENTTDKSPVISSENISKPSITPPQTSPVTPDDSKPLSEPEPKTETTSVSSSPITDSSATQPTVELSRDPEKKYADSYPLADEIERNALRKNGGGFLSSLISFKNKRIKLVILIIVFLLLILLGVGTFLNNKNQPLLFFGGAETQQTEPVTPTPEQTPEPTPTTVELNKAELQIQVLNGSGEAGVAGAMKEILIEKGYSEDIDTGNADTYDYTQTVIQVKEGREDIAAVLREDLENDYSIATETETLPEDSEYDAIIIVGQE